ncbi:glycosyltransferase [Oryzomonas rubra]|uniref:Glycosyltransferase family 1 protein n=1 Tax=Oryzomonas rubra TaxID=2509454 RepID=A0A5A9XFT9_9BACT|nr:glycosyltransferase [Oryzomonas rubra]KAA0892027.1 glycosyltransferase family 1 protein [Oryzomonas rubra]
MKIVCILSPYYDYLTASLMEGLQELGHEIIASENSNYAARSSNGKILKEAEHADLIVVCSNKGVRTGLVDYMDNPNKVFVDGSDSQAFKVYPYAKFRAVFKRELNKCWNNKNADPVYPLPFAAEKRYFDHPRLQRDIKASFAANLNNNTMRYSIYQRLLNRDDAAIFCGSTGECAYIRSQSRGWPIKTPKYQDILYRSRIAVNVVGAGYDCARYWEIPAAGTLLLTQELDITIPHPFTSGTNCMVFKTPDEFDEKLDLLLSDPALVETIAAAGHEHLVRYHTTKERAAYFLAMVAENSGDNRFCESFYREKPRFHGLKRVFGFMK